MIETIDITVIIQYKEESNPFSVDYEYETKEELIEFYFQDMGWDLNDYSKEEDRYSF